EPGLGPAELVRRCMAGEARVRGQQAHLNAMAMCVKHTTYHHFKAREAEQADFRNPFVDIMDVVAGRDPNAGCGGSAAFVASLLEGADRVALEPGVPLDIVRVPAQPSDEEDARIVDGVARLSDKVIERAIEALVDGAQEFDLYRVFGALRDLAGGVVT